MHYLLVYLVRGITADMLSALIWIPLLGAAAIALVPSFQAENRARTVALAIVATTLGLIAYLGLQFDTTLIAAQFTENRPWLDALGLNYKLGMDGLAFPLIVLNAMLTGVAIFCSDRTTPRPRLFYSLILIIYGAVAGAFLAQNLLLFFIFYELELIPLYLLIAIWGGQQRSYAATKFLIYTAISGILILGGFLGITWLTGATSFDYDPALIETLSMTQQLILLGAILIGFGIKVPFVPFHTWLPDAHVEAPTPVSVLLAGVLLKLGTYGLLRFGVGLFPEAWRVISPYLATWAAVSVLYGAVLAIAQTDMKKMVAYSSVSHMGYILLATAAATPLSLVATVLQMVSHGLISGLLFVLVGIVYQKTGTRDLRVLRGLLNPERGLPVVGTLMILGVMASAGQPGMVGFIAEFLVFRGSLAAFPIQTYFCIVGTGLTAVYFLLLVNRAFFGRLATGKKAKVDDQQDVWIPPATSFEQAPAFVLAALIVVLGLQPGWLLNWTESTTISLVPSTPPVIQLSSAAINASQAKIELNSSVNPGNTSSPDRRKGD
jgi:NAD(P)H-quinone oxidoreductase subunit 4